MTACWRCRPPAVRYSDIVMARAGGRGGALFAAAAAAAAAVAAVMVAVVGGRGVRPARGLID